jgi:DNA-binding CsgD family transcriptional regulator
VARELSTSADRARARGGAAAAAAFLDRASQLSPDPAARGGRALAASQANIEAGSLGAAEGLLAIASGCPLTDFQRARLALLRAQAAFARRRGSDAPPLLLEAARRLEVHDVTMARATFLEALGAAVFAGRLTTSITLQEMAALARRAPPAPAPASPPDLLLDGLAIRFTDGYAPAVEPLRHAVGAFDRWGEVDEDGFIRWFWLPWLVAGDLWDDEMWHRLATRAVRLCRSHGALRALPLALAYRATVHLHAGEFSAAATLVEEADELTAAIGQPRVGYPAGLQAAWRGVEQDARAFNDWGLEDAITRGEGRAVGGVALFNAILFNGLGRYREALENAKRVCEFEDLLLVGPALVEMVVAAVRTGHLDDAASAYDQLETRTSSSGTDWALGLQARSLALLRTGDEADELYREAVTRLSRSRIALHLGRAHLMYGEWLLGEGRRSDARIELRTAHELLAKFGALGFADQARQERLKAGDAGRLAQDERPVTLTGQEAQIARLARDGLTNPEIGAQLYISKHTVDWHLRKVFAKLGITSRTQLTDLPEVLLGA